MLAVDAARPPAGQIPAERFGLAGAAKRIAHALLEQRVDPIEHIASPPPPSTIRMHPPTVEIWTGDKFSWEALHPDLPKKLRSSLNEGRSKTPPPGLRAAAFD